MNVQEYDRAVEAYLRRYPIDNLLIDKGSGGHKKCTFVYNGKKVTLTLANSPSDNNAVVIKIGDIRRALGPPPDELEAPRERRTLETMTAELKVGVPDTTNQIQANEDATDATDATVELKPVVSYPYLCTVALRPVNKCLEITVPSGLCAAFGRGGCTVGFISPDLLTIRHSTTPHKYNPAGKLPEFNAHGRVNFGATEILRRIGFGFSASEHRASLGNGTIQIKLDLSKVERKSLVSLVQTHKQKPEVLPTQQREAAKRRVSLVPTEAEYLAALTIVRDLETRSAYRLMRLRYADGSERLTWRAPEIG